jgi:hypothetical protein
MRPRNDAEGRRSRDRQRLQPNCHKGEGGRPTPPSEPPPRLGRRRNAMREPASASTLRSRTAAYTRQVRDIATLLGIPSI